jgi:NAD(P)H-dependent FMN reductase
MYTVPVIVGSTRRGRQTPKVARFVMHAMPRFGLSPKKVDLRDYEIPFLVERLKYLDNPPADVVRFAEVVAMGPGLVVVSPEYNGGCPGVLKNALDHLNEQYEGKTIALVTASAGPNGGGNCLRMLAEMFTRLGAMPLERSFKVNLVEERFAESGDVAGDWYDKQLNALLSDLAQACGEAPDDVQ